METRLNGSCRQKEAGSREARLLSSRLMKIVKLCTNYHVYLRDLKILLRPNRLFDSFDVNSCNTSKTCSPVCRLTFDFRKLLGEKKKTSLK